jgi:hypothetical protein
MLKLTEEEIIIIQEHRNSIYGKNQFIIFEDKIAIVLRDKYGIPKARTYVSKRHLNRLLEQDFVWYGSSNKYVTGKLKGKQIMLHRFLLDAPNEMLVDHVNHDTYDNTDENIRLVTKAQNSMNTATSKRNTSGIKGVSWHKPSKKWRATLVMAGKQVFSEMYKTLDEAIEARKFAETKYFGEYTFKKRGGY